MLLSLVLVCSGCATLPTGGFGHIAETGDRWALYILDDGLCFSVRLGADGALGAISVGRVRAFPRTIELRTLNAGPQRWVPGEKHRWSISESESEFEFETELIVHLGEEPIVFGRTGEGYPTVMHLLGEGFGANERSRRQDRGDSN